MAMDVPRVRAELSRFIEMTTLVDRVISDGYGSYDTHTRPRADEDDIVAAAQVVEQLLDHVLRDWRSSVPRDLHGHWQQHREAAQRAVVQLDRDADLREMLGDDAPTLSAGAFHEWAWRGAQSMWSVGSYDRAVEDALARVNAEAQRKTGRRDLGETKLFQQLFSPEAPKPGAPRLRLMPDEGTDTFHNRHLAVHALAQGLFAGLRNPAAHGVRASEGEEQIALERLAAVSVLARWVDDATLVTAP